MSPHAEWLDLAEELARWAVTRAGPPARRSYTTKVDAADPVTETDLAIERHIREQVAARFPGHRVVGEEYGRDAGDATAPTWFVDPIDGTTNFAHGIPWASCSIGITDGGRLVAGVVADLARGTVISGTVGDGAARVDGEPARCADVAGIAGEVLLTEWSRNRPWPGMSDMLDRLAAAHCTSRVMGSTALSIASVAGGWAAAAVAGRYNPWDVLGGLAAARAAGAVLLSRRGELDPSGAVAEWLPDDGVLAAAPGAAEQAWRAWVG